MPSAPIVPWWQAMGLRAEIAASGGADDVRMSLHDAVYGRKGTDTPVAYAAPADYAAITHPSPSLLDLMARIAIRLAGPPSAAPAAVWHLGQAMGGGKSHGLVGLWHLATNPQQLAATPLGQSVARAVTDMVGVGKVAEDLDNPMCVVLDCDNTTAAEEDYGPARSLGERFLWRLFDTDYNRYKAFSGHTAHKDKLAEALRSVGRPVLVLIDEVMDYLRVAAAADHAAAVQDMAFLRALLDTLNTVDRCAAVVVMIATDADDMALTTEGAALRRELEALLTRNARPATVTSGGDFAQIIQRRLFAEPPPPDAVEAAAGLFDGSVTAGWHNKAFDRLAGDYHGAGFLERLRRSYPFHPELIDLAENEWSHHAGFQKVRSTIRVFAAAACEHTVRAATGEWTPQLIGSGDLLLDSPVVREALLDSGLVSESRTQTNLREVAATDIADPHHPQRGAARNIDTNRADQDWSEANPHAAQRMATAMFVRSLCPRTTGHQGATEPELLAASFVPDPAYTVGDAEGVLQDLEPPEGLASVDVIAGKGKSVPRRWFFETRNTLAMLTRAAREAVPESERETAITDRAFTLAQRSSGPFDRVICVDGGPVPEVGATVQGCLDVIASAGIDNKHQTRLVILDSRWFSLFNGDDSATREALTAAMGLGPKALSVGWASSAVFACAHTALRAQARGLAREWLACRNVAEIDSVRDDPQTLEHAKRQEREALEQLDKRVRLCYKHIVYLAPTGEHDRDIEFRRIQRDALTALSGADVWSELRDASKAARPGELNAQMLLANLRPNDDGLPLAEIRDSFWNNPHKPLLPTGEAELAAAVYEAVAAGDLELFSTGGHYQANNPGDVNLASTTIRLRRPIPDEPSETPQTDNETEPEDETATPTGPSGSAGTGGEPGGTPDSPPSDADAHWIASINVNTNIDPDAGNDELAHLLRELAHAVDAGRVIHLNQLTNITLIGDQQTADEIKALVAQADAGISISRL